MPKAMKTREVIRRLLAEGFTFVRHGSEHDIYVCACPGEHTVAVVRHAQTTAGSWGRPAGALPEEELVAVKVDGATAVYDGTWWVVEVPGYGATQCKSVAQAQRMARALVADLEGIPVSDVEVDLDVKVPHLSDQLRRVKRAQDAAQKALADEAAARRALVRELQHRGLSQHDIAAVAGVSRPAVQKLLRKTPA